jgi:predicted metal-dependent enzyme (double-stranded beta helix superfamily)
VLDLISVIVASGPPPTAAGSRRLSPEHRKLISLCQEPMTVADAAADIALPLGVVRVLLADLIQQKLITVQPRRAVRPQASPDLLREVLDGLRSL